MYSNKFAAKLVNIRQLCKKDMEKLSIFMVLSTYYPTFRFLYEPLFKGAKITEIFQMPKYLRLFLLRTHRFYFVKGFYLILILRLFVRFILIF